MVVVLLAGGVLLLLVALSLSVGSRHVPLDRVVPLLLRDDGTRDALVMHRLRLPRTVVGLVVGAALGLSGSVMQSLTRNPLADPGLLGVNAGAALMVVVAVMVLGTTGIWTYLWFAFAGAAAAAVSVYVLAGGVRGTATTQRLLLAGVAVSAALAAITHTLVLLDQNAFNELRYWVAGSLEGRGWNVLWATGPFMLAGLAVATLVGPALDALALGEDGGRALGVRVRTTRTSSVLAVTLLSGAATAAAGPIAFVGLGAPMLARALVGHDQRWVGALCLLLGAAWLLLADVLARVVLGSQETQVGIVAALLGAPVFVAVVRRRRVPAL